MSRSNCTLILLIASLVFLALLVHLLANPAETLASPRGSICLAPSGLQDYERWFGSQHSHTNMDSDDGATGSTAVTAFDYAKNIPHLKYFIITPHIHSPRSGGETLKYDATYNTIRSSAANATTPYFVAIAGQEVSTLSTGGHFNLYNALQLVGTDHQNGDWDDDNDYYDHVAEIGVNGENIAAQFNHPRTTDFGQRYDPNAAPYFGTIAVSSGPAESTVKNFTDDGNNDTGGAVYRYRWANLLTMGWKLSPSADQDNHRATWGASSSEYTVIVRPRGTTLTPANVLKGLRSHMTYATEDGNMQIGFIANGWSMGQTIGGDSNISFTIWWNNPSTALCNNNEPICVPEAETDPIQTIEIYRNSLSSPTVTYHPNLVTGNWSPTLAAVPGDWFVVQFEDSSTLASPVPNNRTSDITWSAPIWYDPDHADPQLCQANLLFIPIIRK